MTLLLAAAAGISVSNLYLAQPMIGLIGPAVGLKPGAYGLVVTLTQLGYAAGLLLLVPLGDFLENRRLMVTTVIFATLTLIATSLAHSATVFLIACSVIGLTAVNAQIVVPMAAHLALPERRGRQVGTVVSGLLTGILLSRPIASLIESVAGWRVVFMVATVVTLGMGLALWFLLPDRRPASRGHYLHVLGSLWPMLRRTPVLQRRIAYQMGLFFAFSVFWTTIPLELTRHFGFGQREIAVFSLVGAAGAFSAPIAGRLADAGRSVIGTLAAIIMVSVGLALTWAASAERGWLGIGIFALSTILLDGGVQANLAFSQKALFDLAPEHRSRMNAMFIAGAFLAAAAGSALATLAYATDGWPLVALLGVLPPCAALVFFLLGHRGHWRKTAS
ncbi:MFS transporter [Acidisoma cellulosilytica]|uniref:MFS transporter n=1 Tax=Acidisoma cellulosilyticum TaxID=2802395 RepID=A0A964E3N1_9PROT|nr:MFS transporter [Acidisoma cellulosilyticum]MCB8880604.1 MFS transporter [Acidisoma cellulosilyticum]